MWLALVVVVVIGIIAFEYVARLLRKQDLTGKTGLFACIHSQKLRIYPFFFWMAFQY